MRSLVGLTLVIALLVSSSAGLAARGDPKVHKVAADMKRARAMLLRRGDIGPGFKRQPPTKDTHIYCPSDDESDLTLSGGADSPEWARSRPRVFWASSSSFVYTSVADAGKSWKRLTRPATERCLGDDFRRHLSSTIRLHRRSFPRVAQHAIEYRLSDVVSGSSGRVEIYLDLVLLKQSRAIALLAFGSARTPPTLVYERRLAGVVGRRMRAAMQGA